VTGAAASGVRLRVLADRPGALDVRRDAGATAVPDGAAALDARVERPGDVHGRVARARERDGSLARAQVSAVPTSSTRPEPWLLTTTSSTSTPSTTTSPDPSRRISSSSASATPSSTRTSPEPARRTVSTWSTTSRYSTSPVRDQPGRESWSSTSTPSRTSLVSWASTLRPAVTVRDGVSPCSTTSVPDVASSTAVTSSTGRSSVSAGPIATEPQPARTSVRPPAATRASTGRSDMRTSRWTVRPGTSGPYPPSHRRGARGIG
jgi:hypothetical protein